MEHTIFFHIVMRRFPMPALAGMIMVLGACRPDKCVAPCPQAAQPGGACEP